MDRINNITVNGVTYELGVNSESSELPIYTILGGENFFELKTGASKSEIDTALGGTGNGDKIKELFDAAKDGKLILLKDTVNSNALLIGSIYFIDSATVIVSFQKPIYESSGFYLYTYNFYILNSVVLITNFSLGKITQETVTA